ncbi:MAG TPA: hypothetical protein VMR45_05820 [Patescibacteria group bacterium]|nr:hypothetical protein [Patescibacteria group bacterium]
MPGQLINQELTVISEQPPILAGHIFVDGQAIEQHYTGDFAPNDPWSQHATFTLRRLGTSGLLANRHFVELGGGDGRNGWLALDYGASEGREASHYTTVELDAWRDRLAGENADQLGLGGKVTRYVGDAVKWLQQAEPEYIDGSVVFACLPQVPVSSETPSTADGVIAQESFGDIGELSLGELTVAEAGLTLIAASLRALRQKVTPESGVDALYVISDRLPSVVKHRLFTATGWEQVKLYPTDGPVPQDIDTSVTLFERADDGNRFYTSSGRPITARTAEGVRHEALLARQQDPESSLPDNYPHHYVSIHHLRAGTTE